jgi:BirA family biotin operon repressor/biotin-[acetyl-CoA-carboxylase] ligase
MLAPQLLAALAPGQTLSGARLAEAAGVSRAAIWKQVEALRSRGVPVLSHGSAGYALPWPVQMLDAEAIRAALPAAVADRLGALDLHWEIDSTSSELLRRGGAAADLSVVLAETQSAGRGRRGRAWLSPPGLNLYLSCLKRFDAGFAALGGLSLAVGCIVLQALERLGVSGAGLKWPNDVLARTGLSGCGQAAEKPAGEHPAASDDSPGGKLAGILVELSGEFQGPCAAVIGIGLNLRLTPALREQAGQPTCDVAQLCGGAPPDRNRVAAVLLSALVEGLDAFTREGFAAFADDYARHDLLQGVSLHLSGAQGEFDGIGAGVDARGALQVRTHAGLRRIDSADVTVRRA